MFLVGTTFRKKWIIDCCNYNFLVLSIFYQGRCALLKMIRLRVVLNEMRALQNIYILFNSFQNGCYLQ